MLLDIERYQSLDCPDRVKCVEEEPLLFEDAPQQLRGEKRKRKNTASGFRG